MKIQEIKDFLLMIPKTKPVLSSYKSGNFMLIVNDLYNSNVGYDIQYSHHGLSITKFKRDPYKTSSIMDGYESLTIKQREYIRKYLIENYFQDLDYLL